jgi:hypothetical protein
LRHVLALEMMNTTFESAEFLAVSYRLLNFSLIVEANIVYNKFLDNVRRRPSC